MYEIDDMDMSWYDWKCQMYIIIMLKAPGKKEMRNSKYVAKLEILMDYKYEIVLGWCNASNYDDWRNYDDMFLIENFEDKSWLSWIWCNITKPGDMIW